MTHFTVHDETTAPDGAAATLAGAKKTLGFVPSLYGVLAENPAALEGYQTLAGIFGTSGLTALEQQVVTITASVLNECHFCVAAHSTISAGQKLDMDVIAAIREDRAISDARLEALRQFTKQIVTQRGFVADADVDTFVDAGWDRSAVLAVILGVSLKVISNYTNHVAETPVNDAFKAYEWTPKTQKTAAE